ncbi:hypothetical protein O3M35_004496 [Rhynocoris fuscipes]|uniref:STAS domain-containing protein n=1 Tax=Rhynocoris fuscipes TaxID=488301 RepID=A0AAW1CGT0_9HEMI
MKSCSSEDLCSNVVSHDGVHKKRFEDNYMKSIDPENISRLDELNSRINIERAVFKQSLANNFRNNSNVLCCPECVSINCKPKQFIKNTIPSINWLCNYKWKEWLLKDIIAGFTVAVMNIPQGMAYALLGNVPPVVGIYMAFFPVIIYAFLGTSRHVSMGSFAVICLMAGNVVMKYSDPIGFAENINNNSSVTSYSPMEVATAVTFLVGIYQVLMYIFRLGIICTLLSETLVSGFTAGAAIHVFSSQIKDILGLKLTPHNGPFKLIYVYIEIFTKLQTINVAATIISAITIIVLVTNNEVIKPIVEKKTIIPIPIELLVVLAGTLISNYCNISELYNLKTVGDIAVGLPEAVVPKFDLMPTIAMESFVIAIIAYIVSFSMALIFANKLKYDVDANQELLAQGCGNLLGSFFSCLPFSASLSRSVLQQTVGGMTQLASLISCSILLAVLLWIGPFFEPLPRCILASLIVVALKGILMQAKDILQIWPISRTDALIWLSTYLTVIIVEIEYGLLVGIILSILVIIIKGARGNLSLLGRIPNTELYLEVTCDPKVEIDPGITIIRYSGSLNFINKNYFEKEFMKYLNKINFNEYNINKVNPGIENTKQILILDFKSLLYIDSSGGRMLKKLINLLIENNTVYLVGLSDTILKMLYSIEFFNENLITLMPSVHDAVIYAQSKSKDNISTIRL